jgi:hypothetical protein
MKIVRIEKDDLRNGDIVLSQVIACFNGIDDAFYKINSFENDSRYFLVLRDAKIEQEIEPKEDCKNLLGSVWEFSSDNCEIGGKATIMKYDNDHFLAMDTKDGLYWDSSRSRGPTQMIEWLKSKNAKRVK